MFLPDREEMQLLQGLESMRDVELQTIAELDNEELEIIIANPPQAFLLPLRLQNNTSGMSVCLKLRGRDELRFVPIIGFTQTGEKNVLQAFYDVGADCILTAPYQPEHIPPQVRALHRRFQEFSTLNRDQREKGGVSSSLQEALDLARDAIVLFDLRGEPYYMNSRAGDLFGIERLPDAEAFNFVRDRLREGLAAHRKRDANDRSASTAEVSLQRADGRSFFAGLRTKTLYSRDGALFSFAMSVNDLSELDQLSATLGQAQRTRSFGLLAAAGSLQLLEQTNTQSLTPLIAIERMIEQAQRSAPLNSTLTSLLEFLDLVISPSVVVKVSVKEDYVIGMRSADLFQMLGHLILYAVEFAGPSGEVLMSFAEFEPGEGIPVTLVAKSKKVTPFVQDDYLSALIQGQLLNIGSGKPVANKLASGLIAAEEIANRYRSGIQYRNPDFSELKLRVVIPIDQRSLQRK
jgi:PAS domain S-box-containing protein